MYVRMTLNSLCRDLSTLRLTIFLSAPWGQKLQREMPKKGPFSPVHIFRITKNYNYEP